jgi:hypothetical protein
VLLQPGNSAVQAEHDCPSQQVAGGEPGGAIDTPALSVVVGLYGVAAGRDDGHSLGDRIRVLEHVVHGCDVGPTDAEQGRDRYL